MRPARRFPALMSLLLAAVLVLAPPVRADTPDAGDNNAIAVNTEDGASVFRLAFSVKMVANGVVDEDNHAWALASCTACETVALAFQVVLVWNDPNIVVPHNQAYAYNEQCAYCFTYASATQIVLGFDGPVRFTDEGRRRLNELYRTLSSLEDRLKEMTPSELIAAVNAAKAELVSILSSELVRVPVPTGDPPVDETTTVPAEPTTETTTTETDTGSSSTTSAPGGDSTTTTTASTATSSTTSATTTTTQPPSTTTLAPDTTTTTTTGAG